MKLQTEIDILSPPDVEMVLTGTQTEESCIHDAEYLNNRFVTSMEERKGDEEGMDPESDNEQYNDNKDINPAKEKKFTVFESCLEHLFTSCNSCGFPCKLTKTILGSLHQH